MGLTRGITFGASEQITSTKLHNIVDQTTVSLDSDELTNNMLTSLPSSAGIIPQHAILQSLASGALVRADGSGGWYGSAT